MVAAGQYRDKVRIQRKGGSGGRDAVGNLRDADWVDLQPKAVFRGRLQETRGRERLAAGRLEDTATATLRVRYNTQTATITGADRVVARGHVWTILGAPIDPDGRRREIEITLERGGAVN